MAMRVTQRDVEPTSTSAVSSTTSTAINPIIGVLQKAKLGTCTNYFESNCQQVFARGTTITKEILVKVEAEVSAQETNLCGQRYKTKHVWVSCGLLFLFLLSVAGSITMWYTDAFDRAILNNLVLKNNSDAYDRFTKPMTNPLVKIHIFNYTNVDAYAQGLDEKLRVEDVGPYVYEEILTRVDTVFHENGTLSYRENRMYKFRPEMGRRQTDKIVVPNFNLIALGATVQRLNWFAQIGTSGLVKSMNVKPFLDLTAHKLIFGYDDNIYALARPLLAFQGKYLTEKFGLLTAKNGITEDVFLINTGAKDIDRLGTIERLNGIESLPHWAGDECNSIAGTDGSVFSPYRVRAKRSVATYYKDMCRRTRLFFDREVAIFNRTLKAYRYTVPDTMYDYERTSERPTTHDDGNSCYCDPETGACPPRGFFNVTPCTYDAPAFMSFPHFYGSQWSNDDNTIVDGLRPNAKLHKTYIDINPRLGFAMSGYNRIQFNVQIRKSLGFDALDIFTKDNAMLPMAWFDVGLGENEMPKDVYDFMYGVILLVDCLEMALKYGFLLTVLVTFVGLILIFAKSKFCKKVMTTTSLERHGSGQRRLIV